MPSVAELRLKELCLGVLQNQSPKTLAYFRLSNPAIVQELEDFAASSNAENGPARETLTKPLLEQVLDLFQRLNHRMAEQEQSCPTWGDFFVASKPKNDKMSSLNGASSRSISPIQISVVFGGKYSKSPASISEQLVSKLVHRSQTVYTVSRSLCNKDDLPNNVKHIPKQNLDAGDGSSNDGTSYTDSQGADEFYDVMSMAKEEWLKTSSGSNPTTAMLVFYFTLGQHKGVNPFIRNLNSAQNFHRALQKLSLPSSSSKSNISKSNTSNTGSCRSWRVVVTGTDATLSSNRPPSEFTMTTDGNDATKATMLTVPTYKIGTNNFVYAMSKLGQYYWIANAVARLLVMQSGENGKHKYQEIVSETEDIFCKIRSHVTDAGEDGAYHGDSEDSDTSSAKSSISMEELDEISLEMTSIIEEGLLRDHFRIAEQISICYTPLHAKPWTRDAIQNASEDTVDSSSSVPSSQKAFILEQIVKRLKNAISIDSAASSHFL
jgi:hypothetical protein